MTKSAGGFPGLFIPDLPRPWDRRRLSRRNAARKISKAHLPHRLPMDAGVAI